MPVSLTPWPKAQARSVAHAKLETLLAKPVERERQATKGRFVEQSVADIAAEAKDERRE